MKDEEIEKLLLQEEKRQKETINLIASENDVSENILRTLGSVFTNKYAEGYPHKRYYGGNTVIDEIELLTQKRALEVFSLSQDTWSINVQAHSGSPANLCVYTAVVPLGGKIMGLSLDHGGHLTHGHKASLTGKLWKHVPYFLHQETELLDYEAIESLAKIEKPVLIIAGYTAYSRAIDWKRFRTIADSVGAHLHADVSHTAGLIAGGVFESPFEYADTVVMTTHKTLRGPRGAIIFSRKDARALPEKIDKALFPGLQGGPHMHSIAAMGMCLYEAQQKEFKDYAMQIIKNAKTLSNELNAKGWKIISGGTDTHLFLVDTWDDGKGISGKRASEVLEEQGIIVNKNTIPGDARSPLDPSGIRIGVAAETTRGKREEDMKTIAERIDSILRKEIKSTAI